MLQITSLGPHQSTAEFCKTVNQEIANHANRGIKAVNIQVMLAPTSETQGKLTLIAWVTYDLPEDYIA
jgi:hypothetical protein